MASEDIDEELDSDRSEGASEERTLRQMRLLAFCDRFAIAIGLIFLELVLKASTTGGFWPAIAIIIPLSVVGGELLQLIPSLAPNLRAHDIVRSGILALLGVGFSIEYFVFRQFKVFYDVPTVLAGSGDVAKQFTGAAAAMVFTPSGMLRIALFLAPAVVSWLLARRRRDFEGAPPALEEPSLIAKTIAGAYLVSLLAIQLASGTSDLYWKRFSFQGGVERLGLATAVRKDFQAGLTGQRTSFEEVAATAPADVPVREEAAEPDVDRSPNVLDIDFSALAASTDGRWAEMDNYVAGLTPSAKNEMTGRFEGYNLIFISAEAFSAEAIREDTTPTLWRMANRGMQFLDYYQFDNAGTTGGECANIFGMLATEGGSSVKGTSGYDNHMTMGSMLDREGYEGWAFHNNTYTYYGRDLTHNNLGYSHGFMGYGNGMEQWVTWQWPESDLEMVRGTFDELYSGSEPFNVYYMSVSGHSGYWPGENAMADLHWDAVADLDYSEPVKGYLASNIELDLAMEYLIGRLEELGMADRTVIVISADHFPYGLDDDGPLGQLPYLSELYGYEVTDYFQRDHNRLIIWSGALEDEEPIVVDEPVFSVDVLPTLLNLFGCEWDSRLLPGRDVFSDAEPFVYNLEYDWRTELGTYYAGSGSFVPASDDVEIPEGYVDQHSAMAQNRIAYMRGVLETDYYRHVFGT